MLTIDMYAHTRDAELLGSGLPGSPSLDGCSCHRLTVYLRVIHQLPSLSASHSFHRSVPRSIYLMSSKTCNSLSTSRICLIVTQSNYLSRFHHSVPLRPFMKIRSYILYIESERMKPGAHYQNPDSIRFCKFNPLQSGAFHCNPITVLAPVPTSLVLYLSHYIFY